MSLENFLNTLDQTRQEQDATVASERTGLSLRTIDRAKVVASLDRLYGAMGTENYDDLDKN